MRPVPDPLVLAIDQGTSATKCLLLDARGKVVRTASEPVAISYPEPGHVEQDADDILRSVLVAAARCLEGVGPGAVAAVGLSTQRESAVVWDRRTGRPAGPVLGWQDQRAHGICDALRDQGHGDRIRELSGLPLDPMFSAAKLRWLLDRTPDAAVGTVDAWLLHALTGAHRIELGNASRTQLLDVGTGSWSAELLDIFGIPATALPELTPSAGDLGTVGAAGGVLAGLPVTAVLGDSHAALYAHGRLALDGVKVTYGTGSSVMRLTDDTPDPRVCRTIAWAAPGLKHAAEGNIRSSGATVAWLAELLRTTPEEVAALATGADSGGVVVVPAFGGLAAPWWDDAAEGTVTGLTLGTRAPQLARAAVESIAHQVADVIDAMDPDRAAGPVLADGGAAANDHLMQLQADLTGRPVRRARTASLSALGAAHLAGRDLWGEAQPIEYDDFEPTDRDPAARARWRTAVHRALSTTTH